jgi:hypothetical protein
MTIDPTHAARLARETLEDDARAECAPWKDEPNGIYHEHGTIIVRTDGDPRDAPTLAAIARLRNNARPLAEQLQAALDEVERLKRTLMSDLVSLRTRLALIDPVVEAAKAWAKQYEDVMRTNGVAVAHPMHAALLRAVDALLAAERETEDT